MKSFEDKFRIFYTAIFIIICPTLGQLLTIFLTSLVFGVDAFQTQDLKSMDRSLILFQAVSNSLFSYLIVPTFFLLVFNKPLLHKLWTNNTIRPWPFVLAIVAMITIIPFTTVLIEWNGNIDFPASLSAMERVLKESEEQARSMTDALLSLNDPGGFIVSIIVMAIIPGIVEEIFFRGMVQLQLQHEFSNHHYAVWFTAFLFSLFHFEPYSFLPIMMLGVLLGYIFLWSKNIWYPIAAHVTNNVLVILLHCFPVPAIQAAGHEKLALGILSVCSIVITVFIILLLKKKAGSHNL